MNKGAATGARSKLEALSKAQEENERHRKAMKAVSELKMEKLLTLSYIPRSKEAWTGQFFTACLGMEKKQTHQS